MSWKPVKEEILAYPQNRPFAIPSYKPRIRREWVQSALGLGVLCLAAAFFFGMRGFGSPSAAEGDAFITSLVADKEFRSVSKYAVIAQREDLERLADESPLRFAFYRILPGENISAVAKKFGLSISTVLSLNSFDNAHAVSPGQRVLLSSRSGILYNTKTAESLNEIVSKYGVSLQDTMDVNGLPSEDVGPGSTLFLPDASLSAKAMAEILGYFFALPVKSFRFTSSFGTRRHPFGLGRLLHAGVDLAAPIGTPVVAAREGRVVFAGTSGNYGLMIRIQHNNGFSTVYAHLSRIRIAEGAWVDANRRIGDVGNTGRSTGPHLHFEVRKYGKPVHPLYNGLQL